MDVESFPLAYIEDDLGEILAAEELCPGAFYISAENPLTNLPIEYYIVDAHSDAFSPQAKAYGKPLPNHPEWLAYILGDSGASIAKYEALLYRVRHGMALPPDESLLGTAVYGREENPEYFGDFPVPTQTPFGSMVRYQRLIPGVFAIVTDRGEKVLSVCYPIWAGDMTKFTENLGQQTEYDQANGIHSTFGDLFFSEKTACLALFELSLTYQFPEGLINMTAAKNAAFQNFPEYAICHNNREALGLNDAPSMILRMCGIDTEPTGKEENLLTVDLDAGCDYFNL